MWTLKDFYIMIFTYLLKNDPQGFEDRIVSNELQNTYDFIIIGGGSAGSILANRLSEVNHWKILLIEAGGEENDYSRTPAMYFGLQKSSMDWNYTTTKQKHTCFANDGICLYPRGKVLGGSSSINAILYTRGYRSDYDKWESLGNKNWNFDNLQKYFPPMPFVPKNNNTKNGRVGEMKIEYPKFRRSIAEDIMKIGLSHGFKMGDCHDTEGNCIEYPYNTMTNGSRCSTARAFLETISRKNLQIVKNTTATKIIIQDNAAKGVEVIYNGKKHKILSNYEVILSAGAINSPKILMLSGIGPKSHLESLGIVVKADLPVGENLQDHNKIPIFIEINTSDSLSLTPLMDDKILKEYVEHKSGPLTSTGIDALAFVTVGRNKSETLPNVEYHITSFVGHPTKSIIGVSTTVLRPKSRGTVKLASTNPLETPLIDPNYYSETDDYKLTLYGLRYSLHLFGSNEFRKYKPIMFKQLQPQCAKHKGEKFLNCIIKHYTSTNYHPVGTAKMGKDGVVDETLKVHGISGLRVIDASIAPLIISANTNSMAMLIGEMGSDIIKSHYKANTQ